MKNKFIVLSVIMLFCCAGITFADNLQEKGFISLNGTASKEVLPNVAEITFSIITTDKESRNAMEENNKISSKVIKVMKSKLDEKKDTIKTGTISVTNDYTYSKNDKPELRHYTATNSITIKTGSTDKVSELIDLAIANGANRMSGLTFSFTDEAKICSELYPQIITDLKKQANVIASSLNSSITGIKHATSSCGVQYSTRYSRLVLNDEITTSNSLKTSTPVEAGKVNVTATMEVQFFVK